jgi:hypothetical protein
MRVCWWCILVGVVWFLAACGGTGNREQDPPFITTVKDFEAAVEARDPEAILMLLEPTDWRGSIAAELRSYVAGVEQIEFRDTTYETLSSSEEHAEVAVMSTVTYSLKGDISGEYPVDMVIELVNVDGSWYVHGFELPGPVAPPSEE